MPATRLAAVVLALALAGCAGQAPFEPASVRFGRVDYLETDEVPAPGVLIWLNRDVCSRDDAILATVVIEKAFAGKKLAARLTVTRAGGEVARLDVPDVRNTRLDVHVQLRHASPGPYLLRVEMGALANERMFTVQ